jgi:hypothetical protein
MNASFTSTMGLREGETKKAGLNARIGNLRDVNHTAKRAQSLERHATYM